MGRPGVTQNEVFEICDAMLRAGERPTQQTVRTRLGTGSMVTIQRALDAWWHGLPSRLDAGAAAAEREEVPAVVGELASKLWVEAVEQAVAAATARLDPERAALDADRRALECERHRLAQENEACASAATAADQTRLQAEARLEGLQAALAALQAQRAEGQTRLDAAELAIAERENLVAELRQQLERDRTAGAARIAELSAHVRASEDRAHTEVDRARQGQRIAEEAVRRSDTLHAAIERRLQDELTEARRQTSEANQSAAALQAERNRLVAEVDSLRRLLDIAVRAKPSPQPRRSVKPAVPDSGRATPPAGRRKR